MTSSRKEIARNGGGKVFQDPIHGTIELHPLLVKIIDTPQFQRLRNIKQLGGKYFVYPGASHNRFEHCIGTAHLAGKLTRLLQRKDPDLIDNKDVLCVEIAGLCHDLGHGPFSHMFDGMFVAELRKAELRKAELRKAQEKSSDEKSSDVYYKSHEEMSCEILQHLIVDNKLEEDLKEHEVDLAVVKRMIKPDEKVVDSKPHGGRGEDKGFMYEIVSNKRNEVDVDKWDYFARDCHHLGIKNNFDHERFMQCMRVLKPENERYQICARDKESYNLYEMFHVRARLHRRAYQHRVGNVIDRMICDAFIEADNSGPIKEAFGKKLSKCLNDPEDYQKLDDGIFQIILRGRKEGSKTLDRILKRKLYYYLGTMITNLSDDTIATVIASREQKLKRQDFVFIQVKYSYGMGKDNPVEKFRFFTKEDPTKPFAIPRDEISQMLPTQFIEREVQAFYKSEDDHDCNLAKNCLEEFCKENQIIIPAGKKGKKRPPAPPVNADSRDATRKSRRLQNLAVEYAMT